MTALDDDRLLAYWAEWSEEIYCAGFIYSADARTLAGFVSQFVQWLKPKVREGFPKLRDSAEIAVLAEYYEQVGR